MAQRRGGGKAGASIRALRRSARMQIAVVLAALAVAAPPYPPLQPPLGPVAPTTLSPPIVVAPPYLPPPVAPLAAPPPLRSVDLGSSREATCRRRGVPVCGQDGRTYSTACEALRAGAGVQARGACPRR